MRPSSIVAIGLAVLLFVVGARAEAVSAASPALQRAQALTQALTANTDRLRFRHHHLRVIRAWERAVRRGVTPQARRRARAGLADAWARLAHWSGLASDGTRAAAAAAAMVQTRPRASPSLASIVDDVRRAYRDVLEGEGDNPARIGAGRVIVLDPGHGGRDRGATGIGGVREKDINLAVAKQLAAALRRQLGAKVVLTRSSDRFLSLARRVRIANRAKADLFVSIHANAHRRSSVQGVETYFMRGARAKKGRSWTLAGLVHRNTIRALRRNRTAVRSLGIKPAGFQVLRGVRMPAVLVETGFLTHRTEGHRLRQPDYQRRLVDGIVSGVRQFLKEAVQETTESVAGVGGDRATVSPIAMSPG